MKYLAHVIWPRHQTHRTMMQKICQTLIEHLEKKTKIKFWYSINIAFYSIRSWCDTKDGKRIMEELDKSNIGILF